MKQQSEPSMPSMQLCFEAEDLNDASHKMWAMPHQCSYSDRSGRGETDHSTLVTILLGGTNNDLMHRDSC